VEYIHVRSLKKFHPGYTDRKLSFAKIFCDMAKGDPDCELIENETDWGRLIRIILLELRAQKPLPNFDRYWLQNGFDIKKRPMSLTLQMLHNFLEVVPETLEGAYPREEEEEEKEEEKEEEYSAFEKRTVTDWNSFCDRFPTLSKIQEVSEKRRGKLKKLFRSKTFRDFQAILTAIEEQPFLINGNPDSEKNKNWRVSLDWLIENDTNFLKVLERKYKDGNSNYAKPGFRA